MRNSERKANCRDDALELPAGAPDVPARDVGMPRGIAHSKAWEAQQGPSLTMFVTLEALQAKAGSQPPRKTSKVGDLVQLQAANARLKAQGELPRQRFGVAREGSNPKVLLVASNAC